MISATVWLLIAISTGSYNAGNVTVIQRFHESMNCETSKKALEDSTPRFGDATRYVCLKTEGVRP